MYTLTINGHHSWKDTDVKNLEKILNSRFWVIHAVNYVITNPYGAPIQHSSIVKY